MITVFTPMILLNDNGMLPTSSSVATRSIVLGLLLCLYPLGQFVGAPVLGALSDRVGRRPVLLGSLAASTVWYGVIGAALVVRSLPLLMVASFLGGLGEANISIAQSSIADSTSTTDRNRLFGYVYLSSSLAYVVGPLAGGQLADHHLASWFGYPTPFFVVDALLALTLLGICLFFSESHRPSAHAAGGYLKSFINLATVITDRRLRPLYLVNFLLYLAIFGFFRIYPSTWCATSISGWPESRSSWPGWPFPSSSPTCGSLACCRDGGQPRSSRWPPDSPRECCS